MQQRSDEEIVDILIKEMEARKEIECLTLEAIGKKLGMSKAGVRAVLIRALKKCQKSEHIKKYRNDRMDDMIDWYLKSRNQLE